MLAQGIGRGQIFKGSLFDGTEARIVGAGQSVLTVEAIAQGEQFVVSIAHSPDDKLRYGSGELFIRMRAAYLLCQLQHVQQFALKILLWRQRVQSLLRRPFQIDRDAIGQLHQPVQWLIFYARYYFEMQKSTIWVA